MRHMVRGGDPLRGGRLVYESIETASVSVAATSVATMPMGFAIVGVVSASIAVAAAAFVVVRAMQ